MQNSENFFSEAKKHIPGGVNSPVRAFKSVEGNPIFFKKGFGPYLYDEDEKQYIDYICSWGPLIMGHSHPNVVKKIIAAVQDGTSFGASTYKEIELAKKIKQHLPNIDLIRMVNSGTEACMSALRLARGYTGKNKIVKFSGCYHGHTDSLLSKAGSGILTLGLPDSAGVPADFTKHTITCEYNNIPQIKNIFKEYGNEIAAVILEPIAGNMNFIVPTLEFLNTLRELCDGKNCLLIFDEVMTGFRVSMNGAQGLFNIKPDLTCLGKVIGGGMPVGAFGGRQDIMEYLAPIGPVYQAGTLSGNPIAMQAGLATLEELEKPGVFEQISRMTTKLVEGLQQAANNNNINMQTNSVGSMFGFYFLPKDKKLSNLEDVKSANLEQFKFFFHNMLSKGNYFAPSSFEAGFMSAAHTEEVVNKTIDDANYVLESWKNTESSLAI